VLLVSSFVLPHAGGVEAFVESVRVLLEEHGCEVRVLACRYPGFDAGGDVHVPTRFVGANRWPLPTGGWSTIRNEVSRADLVLANGGRHLLSVLAVLAARREGRPALLVVHGSFEGRYAGKRVIGVARELFQRTLGTVAVRLSRPVSVSRVGVGGLRDLYGVDAAYLPYPVRDLPPASAPSPRPGEPFRVVWVGRLSPEKDPVLAVCAVELVRERRPIELVMYGDGPLRPRLDSLARERPWLEVLGVRPWLEVQAAQGRAHACLSTSVHDNVQVALLEAVSRGIPTVSTRVGDAPSYYVDPSLERFCVAADPRQLAAALAELERSHEVHRVAFRDNAVRVRARHARASTELVALVESAARGGPTR
jgi:glycosyltransferase involved in cell wall biosynthesis